MADLKTLIDKEAEKQIKAIAKMETRFNGEAVRLQTELYNLLKDKFIESLTVDADGKIIYNAKNISRVNDLAKTWTAFQEQTYRPAIIEFAKDLVSIVDVEAGYFLAVGKQFDIPFEFKKITDLISKQIGIDIASETITAGSYLDRLTQGSQVRDKIADYVLQNVSAKSSFSDMRKGLETLVKGDETTNGAMQQYLRTYAYDSFSNVQRSIDLNIADTYKLNSFVYSGDVIKSTREFCSERVNGVFTREDLEEWQGQDWAGKNEDVPVEISLGGYNCRHTLMWIPDEAVEYFKEGANANDILNATDISDKGEWISKLDGITNITDAEANAFRTYRGSGYKGINEYVRQGSGSKAAVNLTGDLRSYIDKMPKVEGTLYRYGGVSQNTYNNLMDQLKDGYYMDKGFGSFSVNQDIAMGFLDTDKSKFVEIIADATGKNGAFTHNMNEYEVLFKDATRFEATYKEADRFIEGIGNINILEVRLKEL